MSDVCCVSGRQEPRSGVQGAAADGPAEAAQRWSTLRDHLASKMPAPAETQPAQVEGTARHGGAYEGEGGGDGGVHVSTLHVVCMFLGWCEMC